MKRIWVILILMIALFLTACNSKNKKITVKDGTYTIEDDILTMRTDDKQYTYVFQIDGDKLIFQKNNSSEVNLIDTRFGISLTDNAIFKLKENKN